MVTLAHDLPICKPNLDTLERERAFEEDRAWFDAHPTREWRCRRTWPFERRDSRYDFATERGVGFLVVHRSELFRGHKYCFQAPILFPAEKVPDRWCAKIAEAEWTQWHRWSQGAPLQVIYWQ